MCGIMGVLGGRLADHVARRRATLLQCLHHRGPDDCGCIWLTADAVAQVGDTVPSALTGALLHTRLAVLDLSHGGHQPMASADGRLHLVYNGEIYNYLELRAELERGGVVFHTQSDTEVLLAALAQWGEAALPRLTGMFAFALYDATQHVLTLARDPFGIKPLFYATTTDGFAFASEAKALLELPGVSRHADAQQVYDYLAWSRSDGDERTFFRDIRRLRPGHVMRVDPDGRVVQEPVPYTSLQPGRAEHVPFPQAVERVREMFLTNIRLHLRSDVRVGCALSGGIDSSAIVSAMRHVGGRDLEIHCFSHITDDPVIGEERWVDLVGESTGAQVHKVRPSADELVRDLDALIATQDEPFGSTSIYAQWRVLQLAREHGVTVMLDGQGADELLAGYLPLAAGRLATLMACGDAAGFRRLWHGLGGRPGSRRRHLLLRAMWLYARPTVLASAASRKRLRGRSWLGVPWFAERGVVGRHPPARTGPDHLRGLLLDGTQRSSLPALLRYEDRNSMAFSIESRVPFLTMDFARLLLSLPEPYLLSSEGVTKHVFREAMRGIVPDAVLDRRDKVGFATPERSWLTSMRPWVERTLRSDAATRVPVLKLPVVRERTVAALAGQRSYEPLVWRWLNLIRWSELLDVRYD